MIFLAFLAGIVFAAVLFVVLRISALREETRAGPTSRQMEIPNSSRHVLLVDGPLAGRVHELYGTIRPEEIGFTGPDGFFQHYYRLEPDGTARWVRSSHQSPRP